MKFDSSCERALKCGDHFGAFKVVGIDSTLGGHHDCNAPPPEPECVSSGDPVGTTCDAKVVDMVFEYHGQACQNPLPNPQGGYASCSGNATGATPVGIVYTGPYAYKQKISPASGIKDGDRFRVTSTSTGGCQEIQTYKITDSSGVRQTISFKVSCSKPLALGDEFGSLKLVEFTTASGFHAALGGPQGPLRRLRSAAGAAGPALHERSREPDARLHRRLPRRRLHRQQPAGRLRHLLGRRRSGRSGVGQRRLRPHGHSDDADRVRRPREHRSRRAATCRTSRTSA